MAQIIFENNVTSPSAPALGKVTLFAKSDSSLWIKIPTGEEYPLVTEAGVIVQIDSLRPYSDSLPLMDGIASQGSDNNISRDDHVHPSDTSKSDVSHLHEAVYVNVTGDTMTGPLNILGDQAGLVTLDMVPDAGTPGSDVFKISSLEGIILAGPYAVLDVSNLILTLPGAALGSVVVVAGIDPLGGAQLGYQQQLPVAYTVQDTKETAVTIKTAGVAINPAWVDLDLDVTLVKRADVGTATALAQVPLLNATPRTGVLEFVLRTNGVVGTSPVSVDIPANFDSTISISIPLPGAYAVNDVIELVARVTQNSNDAFSLVMDASVTSVALFRFSVTGASGSGQMLGDASVKAIFYNNISIAENLTIAAGTNGGSYGPVEVANGFEVTVSDGSVWSIV